jgi:sulfur carrier protein ThiS
MAKVHFTTNLRRHVDCPSVEAPGGTLHDVLTQVFAVQQRLGSYVLDEQGALRKHMLVLIDGQRVRDREKLSDPVRPDSEIHVMQALSGG